MTSQRLVALALAASIVAPAPALAQGESGGSSTQRPFFGSVPLRKQQVYFNVLGERMDGYSQAARSALENARQGFIVGGADPVTALQRAYAAMAGTVQRQAALLAFVDVFRLLGTIFLVLLPLVFLMKRPRRAAGH